MLPNLNSDGSIKYDPNLVINFNDPHDIGYEDCIRYLAAHVVKNKSDGDADQTKIAVELMSYESFVEWKEIASYVAKSTLKRKYYPLNIQAMLYLVATERRIFAELLAEKLLEVDVASIKNSFRVRKYRHKKAASENPEIMYKFNKLKKEHAAVENELVEKINQLQADLKRIRSEHKTIEGNFLMEQNRKGSDGRAGESIPETKTDFDKSAAPVVDTPTPSNTLGIGGLPAFAKNDGIIDGGARIVAGVSVNGGVDVGVSNSDNEEMSAGEMFRKTVSEAATPIYGAIAVNSDGEVGEGADETMGGDA